MVGGAGVGYDAARLTLVALERIGRSEPKSCRKLRRRLIEVLEVAPALPAVRDEAIRGIRRGCGSCGVCKGV